MQKTINISCFTGDGHFVLGICCSLHLYLRRLFSPEVYELKKTFSANYYEPHLFGATRNVAIPV